VIGTIKGTAFSAGGLEDSAGVGDPVVTELLSGELDAGEDSPPEAPAANPPSGAEAGEELPSMMISQLVELEILPGQSFIFFAPQPAQQAVDAIAIATSARTPDILFGTANSQPLTMQLDVEPWSAGQWLPEPPASWEVIKATIMAATAAITATTIFAVTLVIRPPLPA
jgi:hypothetical protein